MNKSFRATSKEITLAAKTAFVVGVVACGLALGISDANQQVRRNNAYDDATFAHVQKNLAAEDPVLAEHELSSINNIARIKGFAAVKQAVDIAYDDAAFASAQKNITANHRVLALLDMSLVRNPSRIEGFPALEFRILHSFGLD